MNSRNGPKKNRLSSFVFFSPIARLNLPVPLRMVEICCAVRHLAVENRLWMKDSHFIAIEPVFEDKNWPLADNNLAEISL